MENNKKIVLSHPTGNANVRAAASALYEARLLAEFHTCLASFKGSLLDSLGAFNSLSDLRRRRIDSSLRAITKTLPWYELGRLLASKAGFSKLIKDEKSIFSIDAVYETLDKHVAARLGKLKRHGVQGVYAYEDGAKFSFLEARRSGMTCFYDLPTGYWRSKKVLLEGEKKRWPEWAKTMTSFNDSDSKVGKKDDELKLADIVVVASSFTASTLKHFTGALPPIKVIPYGFPRIYETRQYRSIKGDQKLKLLFVGKLTQQKGIADLFEAVKPFLHKIELTIVGNTTVTDCEALNAALKKHSWIRTASHEEVLELMRNHDLLIFPSLFDGFGLVVTEAMSQGTPVICSDKCAGPDLIKNNENGWLMNAGSVSDLKSILADLLTTPTIIAEVGREAMQTAQKRPWSTYKSELAGAVSEFRKHNSLI